MNHLELFSPAKINLRLDILGKRSDGYHEIRTVFQKISLGDDLFLDAIKNGIEVTCNNPQVPCSGANLAYAAAQMLVSRYAIKDGIRITIKKRIPVAAGLGGGSSNAACTLAGINQLFGLGLSDQGLMVMAKELGADVPFFLFGSSAVGTGIGNVLQPLTIHPKLWLLLVTPEMQISTAWAYQNVRRELTNGADNITIPSCINDIAEIIAILSNDLEKVVLPRFPLLQDIKDALRNKGALGCLMSGSGSTVFGIFASEEKANMALGQLDMPAAWHRCVCSGIGPVAEEAVAPNYKAC
jgi:4-diphosphocytidyl-2-C-methyl-D-erythritol kinase